jgi:Leucine-rich repeat (LRR) protein
VSHLKSLFSLLLLTGLGCGKPADNSGENVSTQAPAKPTNETPVEVVSPDSIVPLEEKEARFDRSDPNQFRIGSAIHAALRKMKNQARTGSRGLKLVPSRAVPVLSVEEIRQLGELDLTGRQLSSIAGLSRFTHFTSLYISDNRLSRLQPLAKHNNLLALTLDENQLDDIAALSGLTRLNLLSLDSNRISSLEPLAKLTQIKYLYLGNNRIVRIDSLKKLENLVALDLSANQVTDLSPLYGLVKLETIGLYDNINLTQGEIKQLQKVLPSCTINHNIGKNR